MKNVKVISGTEEEFFKRGRRLAKAIDQGQPIEEERIISFEDPLELSHLISARKLEVIATIRERPLSITSIAQALHRDRSAVKRDVDELERHGLVVVTEKVLPGHGRMKEVAATAKHFKFEAYI